MAYKCYRYTNHIHIPEYNIVCKNRTTGSHGGVCLYIKNTIQFEILDNLHNEQIEVLWIKTRPTRLPRGVPCVITDTLYHPPSASDDIILDYLAKSLTDLEGRYPECGIVLAGDFNRLKVSRLSHQFRMKQLVNLRTRGNQTLDLILTNLNRFYDESTLIIPSIWSVRSQCDFYTSKRQTTYCTKEKSYLDKKRYEKNPNARARKIS